MIHGTGHQVASFYVKTLTDMWFSSFKRDVCVNKNTVLQAWKDDLGNTWAVHPDPDIGDFSVHHDEVRILSPLELLAEQAD